MLLRALAPCARRGLIFFPNLHVSRQLYSLTDPLLADALESASKEDDEVPTPPKRKQKKKSSIKGIDGITSKELTPAEFMILPENGSTLDEDNGRYDSGKTALPPRNSWRRLLPSTLQTQARVSIRNPHTARMLADAFVPKGSKEKIIIEAYPGPGQLTRALLELPTCRVKKIIVLESYKPYIEFLRPLEKVDSRVKLLEMGGYDWDTYEVINTLGLLDDMKKVPWESGVHPQLHFISHLPSTVIGEQLIAQLFRSIPDKQWLFQFGRTPMSFLLSDYVWGRVSASGESLMRCKLSVIAEAVAQCTEAVPFTSLQPYEDHFHPTRIPTNSTGPETKRMKNRKVGNPFQAINIVPLEHQLIGRGKLDQWDFCLRNLFVKKATALKGAMSSLAPGAQSLLQKITDPNLPENERVDGKKLVRAMNVYEWAVLLKAFDEWSFKPDDLSIGEIFIEKRR